MVTQVCHCIVTEIRFHEKVVDSEYLYLVIGPFDGKSLDQKMILTLQS